MQTNTQNIEESALVATNGNGDSAENEAANIVADVKQVKVYTTPDGDRLYTVPEVMAEVGLKYRALLDRCIQMGLISPIKKPGRQPKTYKGRRFLFRQEQIDRLKKYLAKNGGRLPREGGKKSAPVVNLPPETAATQASLMEQLSAAIKEVEQLRGIVMEIQNLAHQEQKSSRSTQ